MTTSEDITIRVALPTDDDKAPANLTALARTMFNAYGHHCNWATFDGRPMPTWDDVTPAVRGHWRAAAVEASFQVTAACKRQIGTAVAGELRYPMLPESR